MISRQLREALAQRCSNHFWSLPTTSEGSACRPEWSGSTDVKSLFMKLSPYLDTKRRMWWRHLITFHAHRQTGGTWECLSLAASTWWYTSVYLLFLPGVVSEYDTMDRSSAPYEDSLNNKWICAVIDALISEGRYSTYGNWDLTRLDHQACVNRLKLMNACEFYTLWQTTAHRFLVEEWMYPSFQEPET